MERESSEAATRLKSLDSFAFGAGSIGANNETEDTALTTLSCKSTGSESLQKHSSALQARDMFVVLKDVIKD